MQRSEAVARIQETLGFRTDLTTRIINRLKDVQTELERDAVLPWFLLTEVASASTTADEERLPIPTDFLRESEDGTLQKFDSSAATEQQWVPLAKDDLNFLRKQLPGSGAPKAYALSEGYFRLFPTPDAVYTIKQVYYKQAATLDADSTENVWLLHAHELLIGMAGARIAAAVRDEMALKEFRDMEARGRRRIYVEDEARKHSGRRYVMGGVD